MFMATKTLSDFACLLTNEEAKKVKEKIAAMREASTKRMNAIRVQLLEIETY